MVVVGAAASAAAAPMSERQETIGIEREIERERVMPGTMTASRRRDLDEFIHLRRRRFRRGARPAACSTRGMQVRAFAPAPRLAPYVGVIRVVETREAATRLLIPEPSLTLGFRYGGSASLVGEDGAVVARMPEATLAGVGPARRMHTSAGGGIILAAFRPAGAAQFFAEPMHELHGRTVALDDLVPRRDIDRVAARIAAAPTTAARIALLTAFLESRLRPQPPDPVVGAALRAIEAARGLLRIAPLARALAISQDPFEKRFRRAVGATPKHLASLVRLRHAIAQHRPGVTTLARIATDAGYFDQSHFSREFRAVTGLAPGRFFRDERYC